MIRTILAIVAYPVIWWLNVFAGSLILSIIQPRNAPAIGLFSLLLPFIAAPLVSAWLALNRPRLIALLGTVLHHIFWIVFTPFVIALLSLPIGTPSTETFDSQITTSGVSLLEIAMTFKVLAIVLFPVAALISLLCGSLVAKLKQRRA